MTQRNKEAFDIVFRQIEEKLNLQITKAWVDFEKSLRSSLYQTYPNLAMKCYWYQYCLAIRRKAKTIIGFYERTFEDNHMKDLFHQFLCLPFLTKDKVSAAFDYLKNKAAAFEIFSEFLIYFDKVWMKREGTDKFCLDMVEFAKPQSINFNNELKRKFSNSDSQCSLLHLIKIIQRESAEIVANYTKPETDDTNCQSNRQSKLIKKQHELFVAGLIDIPQFLQRLTFVDNSGCIDNLNNYNLKDEYEVDANDDTDYDDIEINAHQDIINPPEPPEHPNVQSTECCSVCLIGPKRVMLQPCNHLKFCQQCVERLLEPQVDEYGVEIPPTCPICRKIVEGYVVAFLW